MLSLSDRVKKSEVQKAMVIYLILGSSIISNQEQLTGHKGMACLRQQEVKTLM
jgi:hypothetical protein